ncbi:hypothetical protein RY831_09770 [Noviherbaspirillum sp. CPCC 100848]|uniref:DUF3301 domain-containing protein n=1 Tax=Noviherbaspirillum album TaxID=3080276 RepID=A0ABU6J727_9BURK|nr:hypothetical protein [Noviherbaspirillum sp. CPCC 100848]MEC4719438.1 hypothetical protein [Noviherbaspirillum sp. CPCC 100848]
MDLVLIEIVLWVGLLFFFWALKDGLGQVESDIEALSLARQGRGMHNSMQPVSFHDAERVAELIGSYRDTQIYRYVVIQGRTYQFDRVCPMDSGAAIDADERCLAPGLVYQECSDHGQVPQLRTDA